jgi:hypothetical protein
MSLLRLRVQIPGKDAQEWLLDAEYTLTEVEEEINAAIEESRPLKLVLRNHKTIALKLADYPAATAVSVVLEVRP